MSFEADLPRTFTAHEDGRYSLTVASIGIDLSVDRLRRERHELMGELTVRCALPEAATFNGCLSSADFNLSGARSRQDRAKLLRGRSNALDLDWESYLEELCQSIIAAERTGRPSVDLREVICPPPDDAYQVAGFRLPRHHAVMWFGDGGSLKSYLALYVAGLLAQQGVRVGYFDWELDGGDHRARLGRLFGEATMPSIRYIRCERALVHEVDNLRRQVREHHLDYAVFDSVVYGCEGPPESAESAAAYFRAVRQIGVGALLVAHITKAEGGDRKPFGSAFWHNSARATWYLKKAETTTGGDEASIGVFNRKANLGPEQPPFGLLVTFGSRITIVQTDVAAVDELAAKLPLWQRMYRLLKAGPLALYAIASELEAKVESVEKVVERDKGRRFCYLNSDSGVRRVGNRDRSDR